MKKKLLLFILIISVISFSFASCGDKDPTPPDDPTSETNFELLGYKTDDLLSEINSKLTEAKITFGKFEDNEAIRQEDGYQVYLETERSNFLSLVLLKHVSGVEEFAVHYKTSSSATNIDDDFDAVIKVAISMFEENEDVYQQLQDQKTKSESGIIYSTYTSNFEYSLYIDAEEGYSLTISSL